MQGQGFHFIFRAGVELVGVGVKIAGTAAVGRAGKIVGGGLGRGFVGGNFTDAIGVARQFGEQPGQLAVDAFANVAIAADKVLLFRVVELRIGAEKLQELGE